MVVRYNVQAVQYSVRVVIVRYRTTGKRLFTQQVLFIIRLSIIRHFCIMCWIVYPYHQHKIKFHDTQHLQNNISLSYKITNKQNRSHFIIVNHQTLYKLTFYNI